MADPEWESAVSPCLATMIKGSGSLDSNMLPRCEIRLICCDCPRGWLADDVLEVQSSPGRHVVLPSAGAPTTSKLFLTTSTQGHHGAKNQGVTAWKWRDKLWKNPPTTTSIIIVVLKIDWILLSDTFFRIFLQVCQKIAVFSWFARGKKNKV